MSEFIAVTGLYVYNKNFNKLTATSERIERTQLQLSVFNTVKSDPGFKDAERTQTLREIIAKLLA